VSKNQIADRHPRISYATDSCARRPFLPPRFANLILPAPAEVQFETAVNATTRHPVPGISCTIGEQALLFGIGVLSAIPVLAALSATSRMNANPIMSPVSTAQAALGHAKPVEFQIVDMGGGRFSTHGKARQLVFGQ